MTRLQLWMAAGALGAAVAAAGQSASPAVEPAARQTPAAAMKEPAAAGVGPVAAAPSPTVEQLLEFKESDVKFKLNDLMSTLRDSRHEGWVLAAYPDPKTSEPLIGAGFTLDLPQREHPQTDPLNPHTFIEPSSAQLWQTAGLDAERLETILSQYNERFAAWKKKRFRKKIATLSPQITQDEATGLLRASAIQATINARAYCRNFDRYTAAQQMALSQLVYQMGVNLGEFTEFLSLINSDAGAVPQAANAAAEAPSSPAAKGAQGDAEYWKTVQAALIKSQWARLYRVRATAVIAMLDPEYAESPAVAERRVSVVLRPAVVHRRKGAAGLRSASYAQRGPVSGRSTGHGKRKARSRKD